MKNLLIKNCTECPFVSHTGQYTQGGAKPCCTHNDTVKLKGYDCFKRVIPYRTVDFRLRTPKSIPEWCPLPNSK